MEFHPANQSPARRLFPCLVVFGTVTGMAALSHRYDPGLASLLIPVFWGFGALLPGWLDGSPPPVLGVTKPLLSKGLRYFLLSSAVVFPLYGAVFYISLRLGLPAPAAIFPPGASLWHMVVFNFAVIAFVEELFFRGYLQGRFEEVSGVLFSNPRLIFWFPIGACAVLFGAAHAAVDLDPARMVVFFPSLLFGWLRAKTGSLIAPILSHGSANLVYEFFIGSLS